MHIISSFLLLASCLSYVSGDALSDLSAITNLINNIARDIALSLTIPPIPTGVNSSTPIYTRPVGLPYNTSLALENVTSAISASTASYGSNLAAFVNGHNETVTDTAYFNYINLISTLVQALVARGRAWHSEENFPVYDGMQALSQAIFAYGSGLTARNIISTGSTIRTITASGDLVNGQEAWSAPGWLPGA